MEELIGFKQILGLVHKKSKRAKMLHRDEIILLLLESMLTLKWPESEVPSLSYQPRGLEGEIRRILIIQLSAIGDVVLSTPTIRGLRESYPGAYIAYLVEPTSSEIVACNPDLDEVVIFPKDDYIRRLKVDSLDEVVRSLINFIDGLKNRGFDWILNLNPTPCSAFLTYLIGSRNITGLTVDEVGRPFLSGSIWVLYKYLYFLSGREFLEESGRLCLAEINMRMAGVNPSRRELNIFIDEDEKREGRALLEIYGIEDDDLLIGLNPGSNFATRCWPKERFARLGDLLVKEYGAKIIIFGGPTEVDLVKEIAGMMENSPIIDVPEGTSLKRLALLLKRCNHLITNDTGPMHIAAAMKTPIIAICGPTRVGAYGGDGHIQIQAADLECIGCSPASLCQTKRCMEKIGVETVLTALRFQRGKIKELPEMPGINLYTSGRDTPNRLFAYRNLNNKDGLADKIFGFIGLNLWVNEDIKLGYSQEPITWQELEERLLLEYEPYEIDQGVKMCLDEIRDYATFCDMVLSKTEYIQREYDIEGVIERIEIIDREEKEKRVARNLVFLEHLTLKPQPEVRDIIDWYISLYQAKREAAVYLCRFLEDSSEWRVRSSGSD